MFHHCTNRTRCQPADLQESNSSPSPSVPATNTMAYTPPPALPMKKTAGQILWEKVKSEPLVPFGCLMTLYFLGRGLQEFQRRDSRKQQMMMRYRVASQAFTLFAFAYYVGFENIDWRIAPNYQNRLARERLEREQEQLAKEALSQESLSLSSDKQSTDQ